MIISGSTCNVSAVVQFYFLKRRNCSGAEIHIKHWFSGICSHRLVKFLAVVGFSSVRYGKIYL